MRGCRYNFVEHLCSDTKSFSCQYLFMVLRCCRYNFVEHLCSDDPLEPDLGAKQD